MQSNAEALSKIAVGFTVSVIVVAPEILPPSTSGEPFRRHWKVNGPEPFAVTEKAALAPLRTLCVEGCCEIAGSLATD